MGKLSLFRLMIPVVIFSIIILAVGVFAAWHSHFTQRDVSASLTASVNSIRAAEELAIGIRDIRTECQLFQITNDRKHLENVQSARTETDKWLNETEETAAVSSRGAQLIAEVKSAYNAFFTDFDALAGLPLARNEPLPKNADVRIGEMTERLAKDSQRPAQEYLDFTEVEIARHRDDQQRVADRTALGLLLLGICGPISGLLAGYGIAREVHRSMVRLSVVVSDTAGKLEGVVNPLTLSPRAGLEELEVALRAIAQRVGAVVERLHQSQKEALRSQQLATLGQLAAGFAHELRNALMPMKILVQAAMSRSSSPKLEGSDLSVVVQEISRVERAVQALLEFARPNRPAKELFDLRDVFQETASLLDRRVAAHGASIEFRMPRHTVLIRADAGQLRQVVLNLFLNALDAIGTGGKIVVSLCENERPDGEGSVTFKIEDSGCGLPSQLGKRIFDPFVSTKETGAGLGLSICQRIIEDHGGRIVADNRPEGGAVFTVELPGLCPSAQLEPTGYSFPGAGAQRLASH